MQYYNVTFKRTNGSGEVVARQHVQAVGEKNAVDKAIGAAFGRKAFFKANLGLGPDYGQVFRSIRGADHATSLTPPVRIDVEKVEEV